MAKSPKILIVDDEPMVPMALKPLLEHMGFAVCGDATGQAEAMQRVRIERPDCVVVDLRLAEGNGISLISELRHIDEVWPRCVVLTGHVDPVLRRLSRAVGADQFVIKGSEPMLLIDVLKEVTGRGFKRDTGGERITLEEMEVFQQLPGFEGANIDASRLKSLMRKLKASSAFQLKVASAYLQIESSNTSCIGF